MKLIICMANTADGKIAKSKDHLANWTSAEDKKHFIDLTKKHKAIIMGENTYKTIGKALPGRLNLILTKNPEKYKSKVKKGSLEFFSGSPKEVVLYLKKQGLKSSVIGGGAFVNASFLNTGLIDEMFLTYEGILFGSGLGCCDGLKKDVKLEIIKIKKLSKTTHVIHYKVKK